MHILTHAERQAIRALADGDPSQLAAARSAFHRAAPRHGVAVCVELQFMSEELTLAPDLLLRATYRRAVLRQSVDEPAL